MGIRIRTNISAIKAQGEFSKTQERLGKNMERLSSGFRINKSADDSAGLAISETMRAKIRSMGQAKRNTQDGISMIQVAEAGMNEITNIIIRLRELAVQSASDTISNNERMYTNREYTELVQEIDRIADTTEFNGIQLFGGSELNDGLEEFSIQVGIGASTQPNTDTISLKIDDIKLDAPLVLNLNSESEIGPMEPDEEFDRSIAAEKLTHLDKALDTISNNRASLGAKQSRLGSAAANLTVQIENLSSAKSRIKDSDFAAETASFTQNQILSQAGASVLSQANSLPQAALPLLQ